MTGRALVVAAHGSHNNPGTALPAWACVDTIRQRNCFDEVTAAFWKEQPSLGTVLEGLQSRYVTIVPFFASEGYFSQVVLPSELNPAPGQVITITEAVGASAFLPEVVAASVETAIRTEHLKADEVGVVVVGHGTPRHDGSQATTEHQADLLRQAGRFGEVWSAFLDEAPYIGDIYKATHCNVLVIVPYFIAEGMHTQQDIPTALGLSAPFYVPQNVNGQRLIYTPPIGLHDDLYRVVLRIAGENPDTEANGSVWGGFPARAAPGDSAIGQISLKHPNYLCHVEDSRRAPDELASLNTPAQIRARLRFDAEGNYRPLATETNLPGGWMIPTPDAARRSAAVETIYPGILVKTNKTRPPMEVAARQKGIYRQVQGLSTQEIESLVENVCGRCVRHATWFDGAPTQPGCSELCSFWLEEAIS